MSEDFRLKHILNTLQDIETEYQQLNVTVGEDLSKIGYRLERIQEILSDILEENQIKESKHE